MISFKARSKIRALHQFNTPRFALQLGGYVSAHFASTFVKRLSLCVIIYLASFLLDSTIIDSLSSF